MANIIGALMYLYCRSGCRADTVASALTFHPPQPYYEIEEDEVGETVGTGAGGSGSCTLTLAPELQHYPSYEHLTAHLLKTKNGTCVPLLCFRVPDAKFTIIFSHGNATDCGAMYVLFYMLAKNCGVNVVGYDYTGYGASAEMGVRPTERQTYQDIETVYDWCVSPASGHNSKKPLVADARSQIIVYGQSLGSGPSCYIASSRSRPVAGLVLHSPILSGIRVLTPSRALWCFDIFPNIDRISSVHCKVFVLHGQEDQEVRVHHGVGLHEAVPADLQTEPWWVPERGHNDLLQGNEQEYFQRVKRFLDELLDDPAPLPPSFVPFPSPTPGPPTAVKHLNGYAPPAAKASDLVVSQNSLASRPTTKESAYSPIETLDPAPEKPTNKVAVAATSGQLSISTSASKQQPNRVGLVQTSNSISEEETGDTTCTTHAANMLTTDSNDADSVSLASAAKAGHSREAALASATLRPEAATLGYAGKGSESINLHR